MTTPAWVERAWILASQASSTPGYDALRQAVDTAIQIADDEGSIEAVTIPALAEALDWSDSEVYEAIGSRIELHQLMWDVVFFDPTPYEERDDWQDAIRDWTRRIRESYEAHRWAIQVPNDQSALVMPSYMRALDRLSEILTPLGFDGGSVVATSRTITNYVRGHTTLALTAQVASASGPLRAISMVGDLARRAGYTHLAEMAQHTSIGDLIVGAPGGSRGLVDEDGRVHPDRAVAQLFDPGVDIIIGGLATMAQQAR